MLKVLEHEKQQGLSNNAYIRCALQILICKKIGFAGVHLSACHKLEEQKLLESYIDQYRNLELVELETLWNVLWQIKTGEEFKPEVKYFSRSVSTAEKIKYQQLHLMHATLFESKIGKGFGKFVFNTPFWEGKTATKALMKTEHIAKHGVVGCESCGQCRLGETLYICPETCPKGLANGPCGGTSLDLCEFGDRECIHSVKARLAKAVNQTQILKEKLIPTVPIEVRGTNSWKNWYL